MAPTLRTRALGHYELVEQEEAQEMARKDAERETKARFAFKKMFDEEPDKVEGNIVEHDGMRFKFYDHKPMSFSLLDKCADCGQDFEVGAATDLESLGRMLKKNVSMHPHYCTARMENRPIGERFLDALTELINEHYHD